jgi:hypothetical protein
MAEGWAMGVSRGLSEGSLLVQRVMHTNPPTSTCDTAHSSHHSNGDGSSAGQLTG